MRLGRFIALAPAVGQIVLMAQTPPLSQRQACEQFSKAIVSITSGSEKVGTGFIVSSDGLIMTAAHVIFDDSTGEYSQTISVKLPSGHVELASFAFLPTLESTAEDFALLKVNTPEPLPFLVLGDESELALGTDATIIGFPFNALTVNKGKATPKFCLNASFAANETTSVTVPWNAPNQNARNPTVGRSGQTDVQVNVIYFQGPSIKGVSGSPLISRDTGHVLGIVNLTLAGIDASLMELKRETVANPIGLRLAGIDPITGFNRIVSVLDEQLANGLGAATGIDDPKEALRRVQQKKKP